MSLPIPTLLGILIRFRSFSRRKICRSSDGGPLCLPFLSSSILRSVATFARPPLLSLSRSQATLRMIFAQEQANEYVRRNKKDGRKSGFEIRRGACVLKLELLFSTLTGPFVLDSIHSSQLLFTPMPSVVILTSPLKTDVVLLSKDGTRFPFRRSFLETASPWFAQAFSKEKRRNAIQMQESAVDLDLFLRFIGRNA